MNTKKKILVLGVGSAQFDLIVECKCRGLEVHGCSNRKEGRGLAFVDKFVLIDIKDVESVMNYVQQMNIDYVYSIGSDIALPTISYVNEKLNLPNFVSYETAIICHNKSRLRETLGGKILRGGTFLLLWDQVLKILSIGIYFQQL